MTCKISCSVGEIIDKISILNLKKEKSKTKESLFNIEKELSIIQNENLFLNKNDQLFYVLHKINSELWLLENNIREKSKNKEFDQQYIDYAESIHKTNDLRYKIKKQINEKYNSNIIEEKIYNLKDVNSKDCNTIQLLNIGKDNYTNGNYVNSLRIIESIMKKYKDYSQFDSFFIDLLFSLYNIQHIFNIEYEYYEKLKIIMNQLEFLDLSKELKYFCNKSYGTICLNSLEYKQAYKYMNYINNIEGPNIDYYSMSFFNPNDKNKTLLLYDGGGLGDKIMFSRFITEVCNKNMNHNIIFLVDDKLEWLFLEMFCNISNLKIISFKNRIHIKNFDYHCSLLYLIKVLDYEYNTIRFQPILKNIEPVISETTSSIIDNIKKSSKKTYVLNWKGNSLNKHEKNNRGMDIVNAIPLFQIQEVDWIVITKDITEQEETILKKYNVKTYGHLLDNEKSFYDSISLLKHVTGVISTDTSLVHISANLGIKTIVLLTLGCEWRWTHNKTTNWYPDAILIRQTKQGDWKSVIEELKDTHI